MDTVQHCLSQKLIQKVLPNPLRVPIQLPKTISQELSSPHCLPNSKLPNFIIVGGEYCNKITLEGFINRIYRSIYTDVIKASLLSPAVNAALTCASNYICRLSVWCTHSAIV